MSRRVAVVTGAAGGIGGAIVRHLQDKFTVVATDLNMQKLQGVHCAVLDVTDSAAVVQLSHEIHARYGRVDVLINCAGVFLRNSVLSYSDDAAAQVIGVNLLGTLRCMAAFGSLMQQAGAGRIINIASVAGSSGAAMASIYAASKAGVIAVTQSAARELAVHGITVNAVAPGYCDTPMLASERPLLEKFTIPKIPARRLAQPDEIAEVVYFLATSRGSYQTGSVISVDGGLHIG